MATTIPHKKIGDVVVLYPEGHMNGLSTGPVKTIIQQFLDDGTKKFIISFKKVLAIDNPFAASLNSVLLAVKRSDGAMMLCEANRDVLPYLEKSAPNITIYNTEEIALGKLIDLEKGYSIEGNIVVVGVSDIARELFKGIANYKGLLFQYFDDPIRSEEKIIELKPRGILLNIEGGAMLVEPIRRWRFHHDTKSTIIILFGPVSMRSTVTALRHEGADDYIEVGFDGPEALAYIKTIEFRNILAKKLDMILDDAYKEFRS